MQYSCASNIFIVYTPAGGLGVCWNWPQRVLGLCV
jgi:hypothetical protein